MKITQRTFLSAILGLMIVGYQAQAIDINGNGDRTGLAALYLFKNYSGGVVPDSSGVGTPLDLTVDDPANVQLVSETDPNYGSVTGLKLKLAAVLRSALRANKVLACGQGANTPGFTVDVYVRNLSEEPVDLPQPTRIVTMSRLVSNAGGPVTHDNRFSVGQQYISNGVYAVSVSGNRNAFMTPDSDAILMFGTQQPIQRITYTVDSSKVARLWVTNSDGNPQKYAERIAVTIPNWAAESASNDVRLAVGNEPFWSQFPRTEPDPDDPRLTIIHRERKSWLGTIYAMAIYCRGISNQELLGSKAGDPVVAPIPLPTDVSNFVITPSMEKSLLLYRRITGLNTPITNPIITAMAGDIDAAGSNLKAGLKAAALRATQENAFYNITVRDMAARMSSRDLSVNTELNDMVATIIGVARDNLPATELLTGNYSYRGDPAKTIAPMNEKMDFLLSNNHYRVLQEQRYDLASVLRKVPTQKLYNGSSDSVVLNPEPAGLITSRAYMSAHALAGTNRRMLEYTGKVFMCIDLTNWADVTASDAFVGRDVERAPGNDPNRFMTNCRACHSVMDGFRGAFAKWDFSSNYVKHADLITATNVEADNDQPGVMYQMPAGIAGKYARNPQTFPAGYETVGTYWQNNANKGANALYFGWPAVPAGQATHKGYGVKSFATLISQSKAFPHCMAKRAFRALCKRDPGVGYPAPAAGQPDLNKQEMDAVNAVGDDFAANGYIIRDVFAGVAALPECLGIK